MENVVRAKTKEDPPLPLYWIILFVFLFILVISCMSMLPKRDISNELKQTFHIYDKNDTKEGDGEVVTNQQSTNSENDTPVLEPQTVITLLTDAPKPIDIDVKQDSKFESLCRKVMERIYERSFKKCRPSWLASTLTGRALELDGWDGESLAFEAQGIQHFEYPNFFHKSFKDYIAQLQRDKFKYEKCKERNINLIVIPYTMRTESLIEKYISSKKGNVR